MHDELCLGCVIKRALHTVCKHGAMTISHKQMRIYTFNKEPMWETMKMINVGRAQQGFHKDTF